jgi:hypothetical protein
MAVTVGARLGPYEIVGPLGAPQFFTVMSNWASLLKKQ